MALARAVLVAAVTDARVEEVAAEIVQGRTLRLARQIHPVRIGCAASTPLRHEQTPYDRCAKQCDDAPAERKRGGGGTGPCYV